MVLAGPRLSLRLQMLPSALHGTSDCSTAPSSPGQRCSDSCQHCQSDQVQLRLGAPLRGSRPMTVHVGLYSPAGCHGCSSQSLQRPSSQGLVLSLAVCEDPSPGRRYPLSVLQSQSGEVKRRGPAEGGEAVGQEGVGSRGGREGEMSIHCIPITVGV